MTIKEAFPVDPEQWIYAKTSELIQQATEQRVHARSRYMTPEDKAIEALEIEVLCMRLAIRRFTELYKKFLENPQNGNTID